MSSDDRRYNSILKVIDDHLIPDVTAKAERGEVFTPPELVREMLFGLRKDKLEKGETSIWGLDDHGNFFDDDEDNRVGGIPTKVWRDPSTKWLDPANGIGNFPVIAFYKLDYELSEHKDYKDKDKRQKHIIENMLYMMELDKGNCATCRQIFKKIHPGATPNICCGDTLSMPFSSIIDMFGFGKFDIIIGNPPFNPPKTETGSSGNSIWQNFVMKSFFVLEDKGYLCFVHPPGWKKPTDEDFKPDKFVSGDYRGQIRQGQVWLVLKEKGNFSFIYTNDQRSKTFGREFLNHFPAVDYYVFQKDGDRTKCNSKNVFLGEIKGSFSVPLNYNLKYLPNLITKETQEILQKVTSKEGDKPAFERFRDSKGFSVDSSKGTYKYIYMLNKGDPKYQYSNKKAENIDQNKVIMTFGGGIDNYSIIYIKKEQQIGSYDKTIYSPVKFEKDGKRLVRFFESDLVKFIFLITQYASGAITQNEPLVANSLIIPPEEVSDYYKFFDLEKHKKFIEEYLAHYDTFKPSKKISKTEKAKKSSNGGARRPFDKTRKRRRVM